MSCARTSQMLDAWIDDELDPATSQEIARHVESCTECGKRRAERDALRTTLRTAISVASAPAALKLAVLRKLQAESVDSSPRPERVLPWWQAVVFAMAASTCAAMLTFFLLTPPWFRGRTARFPGSLLRCMPTRWPAANSLMSPRQSDTWSNPGFTAKLTSRLPYGIFRQTGLCFWERALNTSAFNPPQRSSTRSASIRSIFSSGAASRGA